LASLSAVPGLVFVLFQVASLVANKPDDILSIVVFVCLLAVISVPEMRLPQGERVVIDASVAVAGALLLPVHQVALFSLLGGVAGGLVRGFMSGHPVGHLGDSARRAAILMIVALLGQRAIAFFASSHIWARLGMALLMGVSYMLLDLLINAVIHALREGRTFLSEFLGRIRVLGSLYAGQISLGVTAFLLFPRLGLWGIAAMTALALILQNAYGLYLDTRAAYKQTIDVLATLSDRSGDSHVHADPRYVADTAVAVGRALSLGSRALETIGYAALLRDIGLMGDDEGASHPERGGEILSQIPALEDASRLVRLHHAELSILANEPPSVQVAANVVALCSDYCEHTIMPCTEVDRSAVLVRLGRAVGVRYRRDVFLVASEVVLGISKKDAEGMLSAQDV